MSSSLFPCYLSEVVQRSRWFRYLSGDGIFPLLQVDVFDLERGDWVSVSAPTSTSSSTSISTSASIYDYEHEIIDGLVSGRRTILDGSFLETCSLSDAFIVTLSYLDLLTATLWWLDLLTATLSYLGLPTATLSCSVLPYLSYRSLCSDLLEEHRYGDIFLCSLSPILPCSLSAMLPCGMRAVLFSDFGRHLLTGAGFGFPQLIYRFADGSDVRDGADFLSCVCLHEVAGGLFGFSYSACFRAFPSCSGSDFLSGGGLFWHLVHLSYFRARCLVFYHPLLFSPFLTVTFHPVIVAIYHEHI